MAGLPIYPPRVSDLGLQPAPQPAVTPTEKPSSEIPIWVVLVAILVMLALAAATAFILLRDSNEWEYPARWDSRVAPYVQVAQRERGFPSCTRSRPFPAPGRVPEEHRGRPEGPQPGGPAEIAQFTGLMRAFGLLTGDVDLFDAVNDFSTGGTLAYYSFEDERITIRGERLTPAVRCDPGARADPRPAGPALQGRRPDGAAPQGAQERRHVEGDDAERRRRGGRGARGEDASVDAVKLVLTRTAIGVGMMRMDVPKRMARCVAGGLVETYPVSQLVDPKFGANDPAVQARIGALAADCRR